MPAPTAGPLTAASVGSGLRAMRRKPSYTLPRLSRVADWRLPRFAPAQNAEPAPVTTIAPTDSSASNASTAATISSTIGDVIVLRSSGLFKVSSATPSRISVSTKAMSAVWQTTAAQPRSVEPGRQPTVERNVTYHAVACGPFT